MSEVDIVEAHEQTEHADFVEVLPEHIDRKEASQAEFDHAKTFLRKLYGKPRCIVCELRGEEPKGHIESHHIIEWAHWNQVDIKMVELVLRSLSYFVHGLYLASKEDILAGKPIPSLWEHPELKDVPFTSLDDPRNQFFLCHGHHQQSTKDEIAQGYDVLGIHHVVFTLWILYMVTPGGVLPVHHENPHEHDKLDRRVTEEE